MKKCPSISTFQESSRHQTSSRRVKRKHWPSGINIMGSTSSLGLGYRSQHHPDFLAIGGLLKSLFSKRLSIPIEKGPPLGPRNGRWLDGRWPPWRDGDLLCLLVVGNPNTWNLEKLKNPRKSWEDLSHRSPGWEPSNSSLIWLYI